MSIRVESSCALVFRNGEPRKRMPIPLFVLGAPHIQFLLFSLSAARMPIPSLFPQRVNRSLLFVFGAQAHTNSFSLSSARKRIPILSFCLQRASAYQFFLFVFSAQAHTDPCPLFSARKRIPIRTSLSSGIHSRAHQPKPRWTWACQGPERARPDRYQRQDTAAAANLVVPIASMGHTGSALLPRSSPRQTTLAAEVLLPLLSPV